MRGIVGVVGGPEQILLVEEPRSQLFLGSEAMPPLGLSHLIPQEGDARKKVSVNTKPPFSVHIVSLMVILSLKENVDLPCSNL